MTTRLEARADWKGRMAFAGRGHADVTVPIDYVPPLGDDGGIMPLELLLLSLASCSGATVATVLARTAQSIDGLEVRAIGERRDEHPTVFTAVHLVFRIRGAILDRAAVERAIRASEERLCPVWAMLRPTVPVTYECVLQA